jgi:thioredoxin 1
VTGMLPRIGPAEFDGERLRRPGTVAVAFLADWCPFCRRFEPEFAQLPGGQAYRLVVADLTSEASPLWDRFRIEIVPTVIVYRDGRSVFRADGVAGQGLGARDLAAIDAAAKRP